MHQLNEHQRRFPVKKKTESARHRLFWRGGIIVGLAAAAGLVVAGGTAAFATSQLIKTAAEAVQAASPPD